MDSNISKILAIVTSFEKSCHRLSEKVFTLKIKTFLTMFVLHVNQAFRICQVKTDVIRDDHKERK